MNAVASPYSIARPRRKKAWSEAEMAVLKRQLAGGGLEAAYEALPERSRAAIDRKVSSLRERPA